MLIKDIKKCEEFLAGDKSILRELLHPDKLDINIRYSLAHATVKIGQKTVSHKLKGAEVYFILEGEGVMYIDEGSSKVKQGQTIYIPPDSIQSIVNTGRTDLTFLCIVDPAWKKEDEEVLSWK